jgi:uncharacterized protein
VAGDLVYFTVPVPDAERGKAFYRRLLGWEFAPGNVPGGFQITNVSPPGGIHGGGEGSSPLVWFQVDDLDAALEHVRELGGEAGEAEEIPSGRMAACRDDQGTSFNLWTAHPRG